MPDEIKDQPDRVSEVVLRIKNARNTWASAPNIHAIRSSFDMLFSAEPRAGQSERQKISGIDVEMFGSGFDAAPVVYLHGGGFQIGSTTSHQHLINALALSAQRPFIGVNYRLAPEDRFPAAVEDTHNVYAKLCADGHRPCVVGDSAGGALALATFQRARQEDLPLPRSIALISPWLDLRLSGSSYNELRGKDIFSTPEALHHMARTYIGKMGNLDDPLVSPIGMVMDDLPPTLIHVGGSDITLSDSQTFANRAALEGRDVQVKVWDQMFHHFQMFVDLPQSCDSIAEIGTFLARAASHPTRDS